VTAGFDQQVTFIYVADLDRSARFYGDALGLELVLDQGSCRIFRTAGDAFLGICAGPGREPVPEGVILTLVSGDVDGWWERLAAGGFAAERRPRENAEYRIYHAFWRDPDGYLVEIQEFRDPRWPRPSGGLR
jgi:catechol 2,3-dioxygenase-like lactoylglutathione lyase family enzyme